MSAWNELDHAGRRNLIDRVRWRFEREGTAPPHDLEQVVEAVAAELQPGTSEQAFHKGYSRGRHVGYGEGHDDGMAAGKELAERDAFTAGHAAGLNDARKASA